MNADVGDLLKRLKIQDPVNIGAVVGLMVSMALFAVVVTSLLRTLTDRQNLTLELEAAQTTIERLDQLQTASPENLRQRIAQVRGELSGLLVGMPTDEEVAAEIIRYYEYAKDTGTQVTRLEKIVPSPEEEEITAYQVQHYLLQANGQFLGIAVEADCAQRYVLDFASTNDFFNIFVVDENLFNGRTEPTDSVRQLAVFHPLIDILANHARYHQGAAHANSSYIWRTKRESLEDAVFTAESAGKCQIRYLLALIVQNLGKLTSRRMKIDAGHAPLFHHAPRTHAGSAGSAIYS